MAAPWAMCGSVTSSMEARWSGSNSSRTRAARPSISSCPGRRGSTSREASRFAARSTTGTDAGRGALASGRSGGGDLAVRLRLVAADAGQPLNTRDVPGEEVEDHAELADPLVDIER